MLIQKWSYNPETFLPKSALKDFINYYCTILFSAYRRKFCIVKKNIDTTQVWVKCKTSLMFQNGHFSLLAIHHKYFGDNFFGV